MGKKKKSNSSIAAGAETPDAGIIYDPISIGDIDNINKINDDVICECFDYEEIEINGYKLSGHVKNFGTDDEPNYKFHGKVTIKENGSNKERKVDFTNGKPSKITFSSFVHRFKKKYRW